ncbi:MAG: PAS domain-containing protein [Mycobacterium sp.]
MTTQPDLSGHRSDCPAIPGGAEINGAGYHESGDVKVRSAERRRQPPPSTLEGYLQELPALVLLDRLAVPMIAVRLDGVVFYTNPAFATMLGHQPDSIALIGRRLPELMAGYSATPPRDCVTTLRAAGTMVVDWCHAEGFPVRGVISQTIFVRATDQILLIGVTDVTELMWTIRTEPRHGGYGY